MKGCRKIYKTIIHRIFGIKSPSLMFSLCPYCEKRGPCKVGFGIVDYGVFLKKDSIEEAAKLWNRRASKIEPIKEERWKD